jgi:hypothetical protein
MSQNKKNLWGPGLSDKILENRKGNNSIPISMNGYEIA